MMKDSANDLGMENMMIKMCLEPELILLIMDKIVDYYYSVNQRIFEAAGDEIDCFL